jgi:putative transposon-encoded protein
MAKKISVERGKLTLSDDIEMIFEKKITKFGTGAKIDAPKEFIGKKVYVLIRKK